VHLAVDRPCRGIDIGSACDAVCGIEVEPNEVARFDARKVAPLGIHQELAAIGGDSRAEVVGDGFMHAEPCNQAKCGGKIDAELAFIGRQSEIIHPRFPKAAAPSPMYGLPSGS
jgi:hypothetical protein